MNNMYKKLDVQTSQSAKTAEPIDKYLSGGFEDKNYSEPSTTQEATSEDLETKQSTNTDNQAENTEPSPRNPKSKRASIAIFGVLVIILLILLILLGTGIVR